GDRGVSALGEGLQIGPGADLVPCHEGATVDPHHRGLLLGGALRPEHVQSAVRVFGTVSEVQIAVHPLHLGHVPGGRVLIAECRQTPQQPCGGPVADVERDDHYQRHGGRDRQHRQSHPAEPAWPPALPHLRAHPCLLRRSNVPILPRWPHGQNSAAGSEEALAHRHRGAVHGASMRLITRAFLLVRATTGNVASTWYPTPSPTMPLSASAPASPITPYSSLPSSTSRSPWATGGPAMVWRSTW